MQRIIKLPVYGIVIDLNHGSGTIVSDLKAGEGEANELFDAAVDGLESIVLAHAMAGIDVTEPAYLEGIETAVDAISNHFA